jgi:glutamyl-tRNA(Gln) amidotransferase subunit D
MKTKTPSKKVLVPTMVFHPGDKIKLQTKTKTWEGHVLESHDSEIILLKIKSGYNIGIRESEILNATIIEKSEKPAGKTQTQAPSSNLPNVAIIITGGTISSRLDPKSGGVIPTDKETILTIAPELKEICNPIIESPFMKMSEDMDPQDWKTIAETCEKYLNDDSISGIILTHGTDTLHYTGAALHYFIQNLNKPIALTYSQRSIDRASTDAALNLICAAKYATSDIAEIALIGHENQDDSSCLAIPASKAKKMHTSRRDTFKPINATPIARITPDKIEILKTFNARSNSKGPAPINNKNKSMRVPKLDTKFSDKVAIIKIHPGQDPSILDYYQKEGYKGIILEATGLGHVPSKESRNNWLPKIKKSIQNGITIVATAQTTYGLLNPNVYTPGRDLQKTGIIFLNETTETAFVKLGWILGHKTWNPKEKLLKK